MTAYGIASRLTERPTLGREAELQLLLGCLYGQAEGFPRSFDCSPFEIGAAMTYDRCRKYLSINANAASGI